jgi:hypothetical protein
MLRETLLLMHEPGIEPARAARPAAAGGPRPSPGRPPLDVAAGVAFRTPAQRQGYWRVKRWLGESFAHGAWVACEDGPQFEVRGPGRLTAHVAVFAALDGGALVVVRVRLVSGSGWERDELRWVLERNAELVRFGSFAMNRGGELYFQRAFPVGQRGGALSGREELRRAVVEALGVAEAYERRVVALARSRAVGRTPPPRPACRNGKDVG